MPQVFAIPGIVNSHVGRKILLFIHCKDFSVSQSGMRREKRPETDANLRFFGESLLTPENKTDDG